MAWAVRLLGPKRWVDIVFRLAELTRSEDWFGRDEHVRSYVRETMFGFDTAEYNRILDAVYGFRMVDLEAITVPTLVLNSPGHATARACTPPRTHRSAYRR